MTVADVADLLGRSFTPAQAAAVAAPLEPGVIIAGAGSGKTAVMAARVIYLVGTGAVRPEQVLGLTFTNKAASELAARIRSALALLRTTPWAPDADVGDEPAISTYNAYAGRLVADHGLRVGVEPGSRVITRAQQWQLATRAVRMHRGTITHLNFQPRTVISRVIDLAGQLADHLVDPAAVRAEHERLRAGIAAAGPAEAKGLADVLDQVGLRDELLAFAEVYTRLKAERDLIDFGDQVSIAARVAEQCPQARELERDLHIVVLLDEYQDTGIAQRRMLQALYAAGHPVTAVGDPCQSIYGWRGASVGNLLHFPEHFPRADGSPAQVHYLSTNFRSGGRVLAVANELSAPLRDGSARVGVPELRARPGAESTGRVIAALVETVEDEAAWIAARVALCLAAGTAAQEIAVLARRRSQFDLIRRELEEAGIPVEVVGLGGLLDTPEVNDIVSVLEILDDPTSNAAVVRLLSGPRWRIGPRDLAALGRRAGALASWRPPAGAVVDALADAARDADPVNIGCVVDALDDLGDPAAYSSEARDRFTAFARELQQLRARSGQPLTDLIQDVERTIGLDVELMASPGLVRQGRAANVSAFLDEAAGFVGPDRENDLAAFLAFLVSARDQESGLEIGRPTAAETVKLMTVHAAKGLEWDDVFVAGLAAGDRSSIFPARAKATGWPTVAEELPNPLRGDREDLPVWGDISRKGIKEFQLACAQRDEVEERRLAYVAFTRARHSLHLTGYHWGASQSTRFGPSVYLSSVVDSGLAECDCWAPAPLDGSTNPLLGRSVDVPWPAVDLTGRAAVAQAAADVTAAMLPGQLPMLAAALTGADAGVAARWQSESAVLLRELTAQRSGERLAQLPAQISVTTLVELRGDAAELAQRVARPLPRRPAAAARRGTAFHAWVEGRAGQRQLLGPDDLVGAADDGPSDAELADLKTHFLRTPYAARSPVEVEVPFELALAGHVVRGRMDAVYADDDGAVDVVDYKTGRAPAGDAAAAAAVQLSCYRLAWAALSGVSLSKVRAAFLYVESEQVLRPDRLLDADELGALLMSIPERDSKGAGSHGAGSHGPGSAGAGLRVQVSGREPGAPAQPVPG
ncbi:MAG: UvrD-helicase domain-containing protein [Actinomycetota bacterium]